MIKDENRPVTVGECNRRQRGTWKIMGFIVLLLTVLLTVGGTSGYSGFRAQQRLDVHEGRQEESDKRINQSLERNEQALQRIEQLLRNKGA